MLRLFGGVLALIAGMLWTTVAFACDDKLMVESPAGLAEELKTGLFDVVLIDASNANDYLDTIDDALEIRSRAGSPKK